MNDDEKIAAMPISGQVGYMKYAWERELRMRQSVLSGENKKVKVAEAKRCIEICDRVRAHLTQGGANG